MLAFKRLLMLLLYLLAAGLLVGCQRVSEPAVEDIPWSALDSFLTDLPADWGVISQQALLGSDAFLIDVRDEFEYQTGFIESAVNIPLRELARHLDALPAQDRPIVVICCSGSRSTAALVALQLLGYQDVKVLAGGMQSWRTAGLPVVGGPAPELPAGAAPAIDPDLLAAVDNYLANEFPQDWGVIKSAALAVEMDKEPLFFLDVRQPEDFAKGHIERAVNIPLRELTARLDEIPHDRKVIAICGSGHRATIATVVLQMGHYHNVRSLGGGMVAWSTIDPANAEFSAFGQVLESYLADGIPADWGLVAPDALPADGVLLVDVREPAKYAAGFIADSVNIPLRTLVQHLDALPGLDGQIVLVCDSGTRAALGMMALQLLGFDNARSLAGGLDAWQAAALPLVTTPVPALPSNAMPVVDAFRLQTLDRYFSAELPAGWGLIDPPGLVAAIAGELPGLAISLVDVRETDEFAQDSIAGAFNLPLKRLLQDMNQIPFEQLVSG